MRIRVEEQGQKCQSRAKAGRATTGQGNARAGLLCIGKDLLEIRPKQDMTNM